MAKKKRSRREELERRAREISSRVKTTAVKAGRVAAPHIVSGARAAGRFAKEEFRLQRQARREGARKHRREARRYGRRARRGVVADPLGVASIGRMMGTARPPPIHRRVSRTRPRSKKRSKQKYIIRDGVAYPVRQQRTTRRRRPRRRY